MGGASSTGGGVSFITIRSSIFLCGGVGAGSFREVLYLKFEKMKKTFNDY